MKLSLLNTLLLGALFSLLLSQTTLASDESSWCSSLTVKNCYSSTITVCSYDGDDSVHMAGAQEKSISSGSTETFKCNHKNCDITAAVDRDSCAGGEIYDVDYCGAIYVDHTEGSTNPTEMEYSKTSCP